MKTANRLYIGVSFFLILQSGCATNGEKRLEEKLQSMGPQVTGELNRHIKASIEHNSHLTETQKSAMTELRKSTVNKLDFLQQRSLKLREVLIQDFENKDSDEISLIREHLQNVNNLQVALIFETLKKADQIVGRTSRFRDTLIELLNRQPNFYLP